MTTGEVGVAGLESVSEAGLDKAVSLLIGGGRLVALPWTPLFLGFRGEGDSKLCWRVNK